MLPASHGNPGPRYKSGATLPAGPRRVIDGGERPRFYVAPAGKVAGRWQLAGGCNLRRCRNILVVKLDFLGDWVLTTPFLENLRRNAPQALITVVVLDRVFDLAATCPLADRAIAVSRGDQRRIVFGAASIAALAAFRRDYLGGRFDLALVPRWDADFNGALQVAFGSRSPCVVGFSEDSTVRKRHLNRGDDRFYTQAVVDHRLVHEADRDLALIAATGGRVFAAGVRADFTGADASDAERFLRSAPWASGARFLAVAPFGSKPKTSLPAAILAPVLLRLAEASGLGVVVVGSPADAEAAALFARAAGPRAISAAGRLGTRASAALIARATAFVGMDSGPAHIAAAVGTPVAVISCHPSGAAADHANAPERFRPRGRLGAVLVIRPDHATAPCVDGCEADAAHCILALDEATLWPKLAGFVEIAAGRRAGKANRGRADAPVRVLVRRPPNREAARL